MASKRARDMLECVNVAVADGRYQPIRRVEQVEDRFKDLRDKAVQKGKEVNLQKLAMFNAVKISIQYTIVILNMEKLNDAKVFLEKMHVHYKKEGDEVFTFMLYEDFLNNKGASVKNIQKQKAVRYVYLFWDENDFQRASMKFFKRRGVEMEKEKMFLFFDEVRKMVNRKKFTEDFRILTRETLMKWDSRMRGETNPKEFEFYFKSNKVNMTCL
jgi:hypothetical protein